LTREAKSLNVEAPNLNVEAKSLNVEAPNLNREAKSLNVEAPNLNVEAFSDKLSVKNPAIREKSLKFLLYRFKIEARSLDVGVPSLDVEAPSLNVEARSFNVEAFSDKMSVFRVWIKGNSEIETVMIADDFFTTKTQRAQGFHKDVRSFSIFN
jgi:hypothetical protein